MRGFFVSEVYLCLGRQTRESAHEERTATSVNQLCVGTGWPDSRELVEVCSPGLVCYGLELFLYDWPLLGLRLAVGVHLGSVLVVHLLPEDYQSTVEALGRAEAVVATFGLPGT